MENKMNFLTLPLQPDSIAVWSGGGFNISFLKEIPWMTHVQNYYWGDLDAGNNSSSKDLSKSLFSSMYLVCTSIGNSRM